MFIFFDENVPFKFVQGLQLIEESNRKAIIKAQISHPRFLNNEGSSDEEQIELAGSKSGVIVTFDKDFRHLKSYYPLYREHKVGIVFLKLTKHESNYWGIVKLVINEWQNLKQLLHNKQRPFAYQISFKGIQEFKF